MAHFNPPLWLLAPCSKAEVADIIGKEVEIPGYVFHDYTPGYFIRCGAAALLGSGSLS